MPVLVSAAAACCFIVQYSSRAFSLNSWRDRFLSFINPGDALAKSPWSVLRGAGEEKSAMPTSHPAAPGRPFPVQLATKKLFQDSSMRDLLRKRG